MMTATTATMRARFDSPCPTCDRTIHTGDTIAKHPQLGLYVHTHCTWPVQTATSTTQSEMDQAWGWALERYGAEGVYADGEHTESQARAWALRMYRDSAEMRMDQAVAEAEAQSETEANSWKLVRDIVLETTNDLAETERVMKGVPRSLAPRVLQLFGDVDQPLAEWEIAAAINVAHGRCPDGCCP